MREGFPLPDTGWPPTAPFWEAAASGELCNPRCDDCRAWCWYPKEQCPSCGSARFSWTATSGRGSLFAWAVVRHPFLPQFADKVPFVPGLVAQAEDRAVRLVTEIVDSPPDRRRVGQPMRAVFRPMSFPGVEGEVTAAYFAPADP